jgi:hypothetical protein
MSTCLGRDRQRSAFPLQRLDDLVSEALSHTIDKSTAQSYDSHLSSYLSFCHLHGIVTTPSAQTLARYIVYMSNYISPTSMETYLSGISFRLRPHYPEISEVRNGPYTRSVVRGVKRMHGRPIQCKEPITFPQLNVLAVHYSSSTSYDDSLFLALILCGFFSLLRLGELTGSHDTRLVDRRKTIRRDSILQSAEYVSFILPASKTDHFFAGNRVLLQTSQHANNPVSALSTYLRLRDARFPNDEWLWLTSAGSPPTRR